MRRRETGKRNKLKGREDDEIEGGGGGGGRSCKEIAEIREEQALQHLTASLPLWSRGLNNGSVRSVLT
jgi:hypothetical protein